MPKPNYSFAKRQRELAKKQKKEAKLREREARRRHVRTYGTLIPHVFMSDVLARVGFCLSLERGDSMESHRDEANAIIEELEQGFALGGRETRNVISFSFVSDSEVEPFFAELKPLLGPKLREQLHAA